MLRVIKMTDKYSTKVYNKLCNGLVITHNRRQCEWVNIYFARYYLKQRIFTRQVQLMMAFHLHIIITFRIQKYLTTPQHQCTTATVTYGYISRECFRFNYSFVYFSLFQANAHTQNK